MLYILGVDTQYLGDKCNTQIPESIYPSKKPRRSQAEFQSLEFKFGRHCCRLSQIVIASSLPYCVCRFSILWTGNVGKHS